MDAPGWTANRRAQRESEYVPHRGQDGFFLPVEAPPMVMDESFIGGFDPYLHASRPSTPRPPPLPPKDESYFARRTKTESISSSFATMTAVERSEVQRIARMDPHLQFMVGPLLRYDTVKNGVWRGAVLIVTADSGSVYDPHPTLSFEWDPDSSPANSLPSPIQDRPSYDLGPHPADPSALHTLSNGIQFTASNGGSRGPHFRKEHVPGHEIWVYVGTGRTSTFWRFLIEIPLGPAEMAVTYTINKGQPVRSQSVATLATSVNCPQFVFFVPGVNQNMRWAASSCNGFSAGINPDDFRGPGFNSGYDPVWVDLLTKHAEKPFHVQVGGGDQIYCVHLDSVTREPELQEWMNKKPMDRKKYALTEEIAFAIDRFYFSHYCNHFRRGAFARANSTIPMINMADDHDPDDLQLAPIFRHIGTRGYFFFLLFQCFVNVDVDGVDDRPGKHWCQSTIIGSPGPYVGFPSHSFLAYMGPQTYILMLDCRAERKKDQVCSPAEYDKVFQRLKQLPTTVEHLCVQIGIPIAYPRLVFLEKALESKLNPLVALGKAGSLGLSSFVNKFNAEAELLDDLNDHWTSTLHKKERNWFVQQMQQLAEAQLIRVTFLSGDVHCAAVGYFKTLQPPKTPDTPPQLDHRYMLNVVTSAIVNTPPPDGVITMVSSLATKKHRTMHFADTDEAMVPIFQTETNGKTRKQQFIMGRRNWCQVEYQNHEWVFDIRVEKEKGLGETVGYSVRSPPPGWTR
ncbi:C-CAP/cofactor C-like domain-containing protein [Mycena indigotica]|uniref:C-CAP/cofactor C-like domain-containing protein n=1 Tax=Mycena indigotica TaxID=2126181 RepID=A0A8H6SC03_9AGAR|nr:C-CAP/cofactor C-like domain-containing protein [Mycena indigotica]KAF7295060.1 C-CAP/cofactor C-like domain-containing protein [Mycena indigotica]